jgi:hypothetical protein
VFSRKSWPAWRLGERVIRRNLDRLWLIADVTLIALSLVLEVKRHG